MRSGVLTEIAEHPDMTLPDRLRQHPRLTAWAALALAMVVMLLFAAKDVPLLPSQLAALVIATIALAGLCVWIIHWE
jgi:hypothetical protein